MATAGYICEEDRYAIASSRPFIHTPFLALAIGTLLAAVALGVRLLGVRLVRLAHSIRRDAVQLRAPPTFA